MIAAAAATIGASLCCIGPLVLLSLGIGGAWVSTLTELTPYRPFFIGITVFFLFIAFRKLYRLPRSCAADATCATPGTLRKQRITFWVVTLILAATLAFPYYGIYFFE